MPEIRISSNSNLCNLQILSKILIIYIDYCLNQRSQIICFTFPVIQSEYC